MKYELPIIFTNELISVMTYDFPECAHAFINVKFSLT